MCHLDIDAVLFRGIAFAPFESLNRGVETDMVLIALGYWEP